MTRVTREIRNAMQGVVPSSLATRSADGIPNITYISQVFYVDDNHAAISFQFMNKSWRNMLEYPFVSVLIACPASGKKWKMNLKFIEEQKEGPLFDEMDVQLMAIATLHNVPVEFKLLAALVCEIINIKPVYVNIGA